MFAKKRLFAVVGVALICLTTAAFSQPAADPYADVLNEPASNEAINNAQGKLSANGCADKDCLAFKDIAHAVDVLFRLHHPNSLARTTPMAGDSYAKANKELRRTLLSHPERNKQYCAILTKLAGRFDTTYHEVGYDVIEIASRISTKAFTCISTVLQAFPDTPEITELIKGSREDCIENRRAGCSLISRRK